MNWCRLWHDLPNDPKWRTIARISQQPVSSVISVYIHLLVSASANAGERGRTQPNAEDIASALDLQTEHVGSVLSAMQGRVLDGERLSGWEKRQPKREDGGAERAKNWRENKRQDSQNKQEESKTSVHIKPFTNATERNRTQPNAPEKIREEEIREETTTKTHTVEKTTGSVEQQNGNEKPPASETPQISYLTDDSFRLFTLAAITFWPDLIPEDLQKSWWWTWRKFDFEQKLAATKRLQERIETGEEARFVARPPKYLENGDWKRPPRPTSTAIAVNGNGSGASQDRNQIRRNQVNEGAKMLRKLK